MTEFVVVIPARYASTRLPGKALLDIYGKPMLQHVYERGMESGASEVAVATDDERIANAAESFGATWHNEDRGGFIKIMKPIIGDRAVKQDGTSYMQRFCKTFKLWSAIAFANNVIDQVRMLFQQLGHRTNDDIMPLVLFR